MSEIVFIHSHWQISGNILKYPKCIPSNKSKNVVLEGYTQNNDILISRFSLFIDLLILTKLSIFGVASAVTTINLRPPFICYHNLTNYCSLYIEMNLC